MFVSVYRHLGFRLKENQAETSIIAWLLKSIIPGFIIFGRMFRGLGFRVWYWSLLFRRCYLTLP